MFVSSGIGLVAKIGAIVSLLEGRKRTKHLETMIKTLPYTKKGKKYIRIAVFQIHNESIYDALDFFFFEVSACFKVVAINKNLGLNFKASNMLLWIDSSLPV